MSSNAVLAFDIGGSKLLAGLVLRNGTIVDTERLDLSPHITADEMETILEQKGSLLLERCPDVTLDAIGVNIPGVASPENGMWMYAAFSGISNYPVVRMLSKQFNVPVYIENDVNACAWAEKIYGNRVDGADFLWITISNGVGGGLILNHKVYHGAFGGGGEVGHIVVENAPDAYCCPCGHRGCLESMVAGQAIYRRYRDALGEKPSNAQCTPDVIQLAKSGDETASRIIRESGAYIGRAIAACANLLNLQFYVLGGGIMQSFEVFRDSILSAFSENAFRVPNNRAQIVQTALGYEAGLLGAAAIAWYPIL